MTTLLVLWLSATPTHEQDSTLLLAPCFLAPGDGLVNATNLSIKQLRSAETYPIPHTWRYGADAITTGISSYQGMDALMEQLSWTAFPLLEDIVVAGHSSGGQFTQRWALTLGSAAWGDKHDSPSPDIQTST
jgi:pimeloyl-ACP methyl ester carboxylesterase